MKRRRFTLIELLVACARIRVSRRRDSSRRQSAFTLIELLVVIAIIAILAAILFPVFARAREKARQAACTSNANQIAKGLAMYIQDYDERSPGGCYSTWSCNLAAPGQPANNWHINDQGVPTTPAGGGGCCNYTGLFPLGPYLKNVQVFVCPSQRRWTSANTRPTPGSMITNSQVMNVALSAIQAPANTVAFADSLNPWRDDNFGSNFLYCRIGNGFHCNGVSGNQFICVNCSMNRTDWHNEGINQVYMDGHAKWSRLDQIKYGQWARSDFNSTGGNPVIGAPANPTDRHSCCPITIPYGQCNHPCQ